MQDKKRNRKPLLFIGAAAVYLLIFLCAGALLLSVLLQAFPSIQAQSEQPKTTETEPVTEGATNTLEQTTQIPVPVPPNDWYGYTYGLETVLADSYLQAITFDAEPFCLPYDPNIGAISGTVAQGKIELNGILYKDIAHEVELLTQFDDNFLLFYANSPDELSVIQRIQRTRACSVIRNPNAENSWKQIAIYRIEKLYYFVFFDQDGMVERIHAAEIRYTKLDEIFESGLSKNLILEIEEYMFEQNAFINPAPDSFALKLNRIKEYGLQPLLVKFNPEDYYYACAYYTPTHEYPKIESHDFCCKEQYIWVKYDSPEQIAEQYDGMNLICAFQVNWTLYCKDIGQEGGLSKDLAYFHRYTPVFENGFNIGPCIDFDQSLIYLNESNLETTYHSTDLFDHAYKTFECVELDGQLYVPIHLRTVKDDGTQFTSDIAWELDAYYDHIMSVMITDKYSIYNSKTGSTKHYGLISLEDMQDMIFE